MRVVPASKVGVMGRDGECWLDDSVLLSFAERVARSVAECDPDSLSAVGSVARSSANVLDDREQDVEICRSLTALSVASKCSGNVRPLFSARLRIPLAARGLKKNRCGTFPLSRRMSDK